MYLQPHDRFERVCMYLRKSRADIEAEARGEGETLAKHRKQLFTLAEKMNIHIVKIREEIVSGERIIDRPEMIELLREVEAGDYDAVLVMDIDRLGRGDMIDQGTILRAFKSSGTKIITPMKVYDLDNEFDEEYTEFEAFMARKELKMINKRLQRGRIASVKEGNYIATRPPYGYQVKDKVLYPHPEQSEVVRMIFDMYANQNMGTSKIARYLNSLGIPSYTGKRWSPYSINMILKNEVYIGRIQWRKKEIDKKRGIGRRRPRDQWIDVEGKHEPLIDEVTFSRVQQILERKYHVPYNRKITNPLAGLVECGFCGSSMVLRPYTHQPPHIRCYNVNCTNKSSQLKYVEERVLEVLETWYDQYVADVNKASKRKRTEKRVVVPETLVRSLENQLAELRKQKGNLHDLLERGIYDADTYLERSQLLAQRIEETEQSLLRACEEMNQIEEQERTNVEIIPIVRQVFKEYWKAKDAETKNKLLKRVMAKVVYKKEKHMYKDEFELDVYPLLPRQRLQWK
jgi:site-specific DNA recombinase